MEADDLPCSRNARPQKVLVGRAQLGIDLATGTKRCWQTRKGNGKGLVITHWPTRRCFKQRLTAARREIPLLLIPVSSPTLFALLSYFP